MSQALVSAGVNAQGQQMFLDTGSNPSAGGLPLPGAGGATTAVRLPNGSIINVATQDVPNLVAAYQQLTQQQQQVVDLAGGGSGNQRFIPNTGLGAAAKAGEAVSELFTGLSISRLVDKAAAARAASTLAKKTFVDQTQLQVSGDPKADFGAWFQALVDYMDSNDARNDAQDDVNGAIAMQAYVNAGGNALELVERFQSPQASVQGLFSGGAGTALAVGGGGALLLSTLLSRRAASVR